MKELNFIRKIRNKKDWIHKNSITVKYFLIRILFGILLLGKGIEICFDSQALKLSDNFILPRGTVYCFIYLGVILILSAFRRNPNIAPLFNIVFFPLKSLITLMIYFIRYIYIPYAQILLLLVIVIIFNMFIPIKSNFLLLYLVILGVSVGTVSPLNRFSKKTRNMFYYTVHYFDLAYRQGVIVNEDYYDFKKREFNKYKVNDVLSNIALTLRVDENEDFTGKSRKVIYTIYFFLIGLSGYMKFYLKDVAENPQFAESAVSLAQFLPSFDVTCSAFVTFLAFDNVSQMKALPTKTYFKEVFQRIKAIFRVFD